MKEVKENAHRMEILLQNLIPHFVRTASFRLVPQSHNNAPAEVGRLINQKFMIFCCLGKINMKLEFHR